MGVGHEPAWLQAFQSVSREKEAREREKERHAEALADTYKKLALKSLPLVSWQWEDGTKGSGQWKPFGDGVCQTLEILWQRLQLGGASTPETLDGLVLNPSKPKDLYDAVVCTRPGFEMHQKNTRTGYARPMRRAERGSAAAPAAPASSDMTEAQKTALSRTQASAAVDSSAAMSDLVKACEGAVATATADQVGEVLKYMSKCSLHINLDIFKDCGGRTLLQILCEEPRDPGPDGRMINLFELHDRFPGSRGGGSDNETARKGWERRMYGDTFEGKNFERPKYGNLNLLANLGGDARSRQYGKSYLVLKPGLWDRCTITSRDSSSSSAKLGNLGHCAHVLLDQLHEVASSAKRRNFVKSLLALSRGEDPKVKTGDLMRHYVEVQFHGEVIIPRDVAMVVLTDKDAAKARGLQTLVNQFTTMFNVPVFCITKSGRLVHAAGLA